ncbi:Hsp33 family molecular chaperone HslO [Ferroacidibacillus organovorans]|nr:Hsp33 family molecular chaperone HslO [Ferroacidibacillus organovorans]
MTDDYVATGTTRSGHIVGYAARSTSLVRTLQVRHNTWPVASAALGRVATMGAIMTVGLKRDDHQVTIQVRGDGPLGNILVVATGRGDVRGMVDEPRVELELNAFGKLNVGMAVGREGSLYVTKDLGLKEPYRGSVPLVSGEIGEDFTYYYAVSEQTPSAVSVGVLVDRDYTVISAGGILVQALPDAEEDELRALEDAMARMPNVSSLIRDGATPEDLLKMACGSDLQVLDQKPIQFQCTCSKERLSRVLLSLGREELKKLAVEQDSTELVCHFCVTAYHFSREEIVSLHELAKY